MASPLKDQVDQAVVEDLANRFAALEVDFDAERFVADVLDDLDALELKDRVNLIADRLADHLPDDPEAAIDLVVTVAQGGADGWTAWPLCAFVERHGLDAPEASLSAMAELTKRATCEFAVRPFLGRHLELARRHLRQWVDDPDESVRRLASEGTRPLLPWAPRVACLTDDPGIGLDVLDALRHDGSEFVRRSVANHLNDLSRADPTLVVDVLRRWTADDRPIDPGMVRHALRTLVKQGHPGALELLGFATDPVVDVVRFTCDPTTIQLGQQIELEAELRSQGEGAQRLIVDFAIHHVRADGEATPKVFKWTTCDLAPGESVTLRKRRRIQTASTRHYHAGVHRIDLQVAGRAVASTAFELEDSSPRP